MLDRHEITRLYDRHAEAMLGFFARRTFDPEAAVDLVAETFATAYVSRSRVRGDGDEVLAAWLYGIARNLLADWHRRAGVERRALARLGVERRPLTDAELDRIDELAGLGELRADLDAAFARAEDARPSRRLSRWLLPAGGAALAVAAAVVALTSGVESGRLGPAPANAAEALRQVAAVAARAPAQVPRDDQFYYVKTKALWLSMGASGAARLVEHDREIWLSIDRPGRLIDRIVASRPLTPAASGNRALDGPGDIDQSMEPAGHFFVGSEQLTRAELLAFPADPRTIFDRLRARVGDRGNSPDGQVFTEIGDALRESPAPAALRAGLYRALALVPGIELVGRVTDRAGRAGVAIAYTEIGIRRELIFDPETSELLAEREVLVDPRPAELDAPPGTVIGDAVYLRRAVTDDVS